jgi:hypothetical protein
MRLLAAYAFAAMFCAVSTAAQDVSERPVARPGTSADAATPRPAARPGSTSQGTIGVQVEQSGSIRQPRRGPDAEPAINRGRTLDRSGRPAARTPKVELTARQQRRLQEKGAVCGDLDIQGEAVGGIRGRIKACNVADAVKVRSVSGIRLSQSAVMDCRTAAALKTWVDTSAKPALRDMGGGLKSLRVAAHYACRTRNNQAGARVSEHGKGRAIDISGFRLRDGSKITVLKGWNARSTSQALRKMHRGACGPFGTVLGPESDSHHRDHFHFDTARYRSGPYCR